MPYLRKILSPRFLASYDKQDGALQQSGHGTYIFVIEGKISVAEEVLHKRDGMGVEGVDQLVCQGIETSDVLLIEVPM